MTGVVTELQYETRTMAKNTPVGKTGRMPNLRDVQLTLPKEGGKMGRSLHFGIHGSNMCHISEEMEWELIGKYSKCKRHQSDTDEKWCHSTYSIYLMHASSDFLDSSPCSWVRACCAFATISSKKGDATLEEGTTRAPHTSTQGS